jgi:hypothetical protein
MNPITLGMDGLLAGLLLIAVLVGLRLNGRLKALRESHAGFAKAVSELDAAAAKADSALKSLHLASDQTHDDLLARIETARSLILRLEKAGRGLSGPPNAPKRRRRADHWRARRPQRPDAPCLIFSPPTRFVRRRPLRRLNQPSDTSLRSAAVRLSTKTCSPKRTPAPRPRLPAGTAPA